MLVHPYTEQHRLVTCGDTRLLVETFGLIGMGIPEDRNPHRLWTIQSFYSPIKGRNLGGIRAKLKDQKDFISFVNQRDLEVLLGIGESGTYCRWLGEEYPEIYERGWFGLCADDEDLRDDLFDRELAIRAEYGGLLPQGSEIVRRVHLDQEFDVQELWALMWDMDKLTGISPDPRFKTVLDRWVRVERERVKWDHMT